MMYRVRDGKLEVFLAHPGGPYFTKKDAGHWSIPKGEVEAGEELLVCALREFEEEIGLSPHGPFLALGSIKQKGGKIVHAWAFEGDRGDDRPLAANHFRLEWPPRSGNYQSFPEVDRAQFFSLVGAREKIKEAQATFIDRLVNALGGASRPISP